MQGGTFTYDALGRLTTQTSAASNRVFSYDANGNHIRMEQASAPSSTVSFTLDATSNRIGNRVGTAVACDSAGHQTGDPETGATHTYDDVGRLWTASVGGVLKSTRLYNGLGQRVVKDKRPHDGRVVRTVDSAVSWKRSAPP